MLKYYTDQQKRFDYAFSTIASFTSVICEECGRTYFVTSDGHGGYDEGELEKLRLNAEREPDKYIEVPDFSYVAAVPLNGKQLVIGCLCDPTKPFSEWIEAYADQLTMYLCEYWQDKKKEASWKLSHAEDMAEDLKDAKPKDLS